MANRLLRRSFTILLQSSKAIPMLRSRPWEQVAPNFASSLNTSTSQCSRTRARHACVSRSLRTFHSGPIYEPTNPCSSKSRVPSHTVDSGRWLQDSKSFAATGEQDIQNRDPRTATENAERHEYDSSEAVAENWRWAGLLAILTVTWMIIEHKDDEPGKPRETPHQRRRRQRAQWF